MGADAFHVCYGLRWEIDSSSEGEVAQLERREDPRQLAAKRFGLDSWWGVTTDEGRYFLLVGKLVGNFGWEGEHAAQISGAVAMRLIEETTAKLRMAKLEGEPAWHYQFQPDY